MVEKISELTRLNVGPLKTFFGVSAIVFLMVFGASTLITFLLPESYASTARIKVEPHGAPTNGQTTSRTYDPYLVQTEFEVLQSEVILNKVIESLNLNAVWGKKYAGGEKLKTSETLALLKGRLDLRPVGHTSLIEIRMFSEDPAEAAQVANAVAEAYRDHRWEQARQGAKNGVNALRERYAEQEQKVRVARQEVDKLRKELNISATDATGNSPAVVNEADVVRRLQGELITLETMLVREETQLRELEKLGPDQRRNAIQTSVGPDAELNTLLGQLNLSEQRLLSLEKEYAPEHPARQNAKLRADDSLRRVNARLEGIMTGLSNRVTGLQLTISNLKKIVEEARATDIDKAERSRPYYEAKVRLEELERFRSLLNLKLASEALDAELPGSALVEIIDRAMPGLRPVRPNKPLNLFLGALGGMILAMLIGCGSAVATFVIGKKRRS